MIQSESRIADFHWSFDTSGTTIDPSGTNARPFRNRADDPLGTLQRHIRNARSQRLAQIRAIPANQDLLTF